LSAVNLSAKFNDATFFPFPVNSIEQKNLALNGNLGLIYRPTKEWKLSVLASSGFRAPNVDDLSKVFESVPGSVIVPNPNLKPEYTYNLDLSASRMWNDKISISATGFYTWYQNAITTKTSSFNGQDSLIYSGQLSQVISSVNASEAYLYGANFSLSAQITTGLRFTHTTNFTFGRITTGKEEIPLDHIAPTFGKTSVMYQKEKLKTEFFVLYNAAKKTKDYNPYGEDNQAFSADPINGYMPAWLTLNARLGYQIGKSIQLMGAVENIADINYRVFASNISASGRSFSLTLRGMF
jgi:hemoglobin/transferrin/lactoferrin receptor protein